MEAPKTGEASGMARAVCMWHLPILRPSPGEICQQGGTSAHLGGFRHEAGDTKSDFDGPSQGSSILGPSQVEICIQSSFLEVNFPHIMPKVPERVHTVHTLSLARVFYGLGGGGMG